MIQISGAFDCATSHRYIDSRIQEYGMGDYMWIKNEAKIYKHSEDGAVTVRPNGDQMFHTATMFWLCSNESVIQVRLFTTGRFIFRCLHTKIQNRQQASVRMREHIAELAALLDAGIIE